MLDSERTKAMGALCGPLFPGTGELSIVRSMVTVSTRGVDSMIGRDGWLILRVQTVWGSQANYLHGVPTLFRGRRVCNDFLNPANIVVYDTEVRLEVLVVCSLFGLDMGLVLYGLHRV